jgi:hypothetical protein
MSIADDRLVRDIRPGWAAAGLAAVAAVTVLTACGTVAQGQGGTDGGRAGGSSGCVTTVRGVVSGPGSLLATWLPGGYRLQTGAQPASSLPASTYVQASRRPDPSRIMLSAIDQRGPLTAADGGRATGVPVLVQGHHGLAESGPPAAQFDGVYWKPSAGYVVSVVGYKVAPSVLLRVARSVAFVAPGIIALPVTPGHIVTRQVAISAAERATRLSWRRATAKLSSWAEVQALATRAQPAFPGAPRELSASPWRPVWAVLLSGSQRSSVVVVDAASGQPEFTITVRGPWFAALTDRDQGTSRQCPGGSTARVPFGVLTRTEEEHSVYLTANGDASTSLQLVLSTVPAVNKADGSLYGGCFQQDCRIDQLVWVTITTVRAAPGKTVACLPGSASVPPGYKPDQVNQYYTVAVPGNFGIGCGKAVPSWLSGLKDLAPPA